MHDGGDLSRAPPGAGAISPGSLVSRGEMGKKGGIRSPAAPRVSSFRFGGRFMLFRRLLSCLVVLGAVVALSVPALAQDKDKAKDKDKDKPKDKATAEKPGDKPADKGGPTVTLKWKFEKDKPFYQKMTTKTVQSMKVMNNDVNQTQNQTFYFSWKPTKIEGDKVTIDQEIIGVAMDIEIGGSKISYDSSKDQAANNPLGDFFKALVGSKFTVTLDTKELKVTDMTGRDEFLKKLVAANPGMKQLLDTILSQDALKEMAEPTFAVIPTKPVAKGDKWTRTSKLDMGPIGKYENTYNYTYEGGDAAGDKAVERIKVETILNYKEPGDTAGQGGLPFKIKSAKLKSANPVGQVIFNSAKGRVDKSTMKLELKGDLAIEIGGQVTTVNLSQNQESIVETMDENPLAKKK
jgi:hypothetical protein